MGIKNGQSRDTGNTGHINCNMQIVNTVNTGMSLFQNNRKTRHF